MRTLGSFEGRNKVEGPESGRHREVSILFFQVNMSSPEGPQRKLQVPVIEGQGTPSKYW